jgi:recombination protein RecA
MYGEGISKTGEIVDLGVKAGIIEKSGAWFSYNGDKLGQGRENDKIFLRDNPELSLEIENKIKAQSGILSAEMIGGDTIGDDE